MEFRTVAAAIGIILVIVYAFGSGVWTSSSPGWYGTLNRPPWQPPNFVFGLIWPYNFIVLGIASYRISMTLNRNETIIWLSCFALSVVAALSWAYNFYVPHNLQFAPFSLWSLVPSRPQLEFSWLLSTPLVLGFGQVVLPVGLS